MPVRQMGKTLNEKGVSLTDRAIRKRIAKLEENEVIRGYTAIVDHGKVGLHVRRLMLLRLRSTENFESRINDLILYFRRSQSCIFSARLSGDLDWAMCGVFKNDSEAKIESDRIRTLFHDVIEFINTYEVEMVKG
ncbi:MAG: hypothetical protein HYU39_02565 [Thaumarchaeota archaeon]|nr:hypothetical protein [Nitrososphaerota archaeon]